MRFTKFHKSVFTFQNANALSFKDNLYKYPQCTDYYTNIILYERLPLQQ